jgi:2,4-dienoyl-CoA reductase-like NADH-dependent reductase (Old Yellow Enzyme family)/nucleotide-binding universal stress UspA family protein
MTSKPTIHTPLPLGPHVLKNRLVALPVFTGYAYPDGSVSPLLRSHYAALAASGVAMVVVANAAVAPDGVTSRYNLRIDADRYIPGLAGLARSIQEQGALACIQLNHAGRFAKTPQPLLVSAADASHLTYNLSALKDFINSFPFERRFRLTGFFLKQFATWHRAMTGKEIDTLIAQFCEAAGRAHQAGFDMIELHGANGYLVCEFLSPATNKLKSGFGGSLENRMAFPLTVVRAISQTLPPEVPLGFRLLLNEWVPGGIELEESIALARVLEKAGIAYLSAAAGTFNSIFRSSVAKKMARCGYLRQEMAALTRAVTIPTIISGRVLTPALADELLKHRTSDLIGLGRPLRVDPHWVTKAQTPAARIRTCTNCNTCLKRVILEQGFNCPRWPKPLQLRTDLDHKLLTRNYRGLWVIGDADDLAAFQNGLPELLPAGLWDATRHPPTVLFPSAKAGAGIPLVDRSAFADWIRQLGKALGHPAAAVSTLDQTDVAGWNQVVWAEAERGHFGLILIGRNPHQPWRERLLYALRHKVVGLVSPNDCMHDVAVLLDFSASSLLILAFLQHAYGQRPDYRLHFIHVCGEDGSPARRRWMELKEAVDLHRDSPIKLIHSRGDTTAAILDEITTHPYGTIVMGKRGLSGIKRMLLGSVSRAVLRRIDRQSLFLVD